ncbi:hypothetical protein MPL3356_110150 [Mesorhizobium plurifarium]|uniref:Uncharacterized protein n=1 Tax=Mesorhizobium plurifarium TaxID=69974 RepID=A0A090D9U5_MESPL|nr:hypothetical protein MPL3356_110150 [Mesorhizobium plurifarium]
MHLHPRRLPQWARSCQCAGAIKSIPFRHATMASQGPPSNCPVIVWRRRISAMMTQGKKLGAELRVRLAHGGVVAFLHHRVLRLLRRGFPRRLEVGARLHRLHAGIGEKRLHIGGFVEGAGEGHAAKNGKGKSAEADSFKVHFEVLLWLGSRPLDNHLIGLTAIQNYWLPPCCDEPCRNHPPTRQCHLRMKTMPVLHPQMLFSTVAIWFRPK